MWSKNLSSEIAEMFSNLSVYEAPRSELQRKEAYIRPDNDLALHLARDVGGGPRGHLASKGGQALKKKLASDAEARDKYRKKISAGMRKKSADKRAKVFALIDGGMTKREVVSEVGVSIWAVKKWLSERRKEAGL